MPPVTLAINENLLAPSDDIRVLLFDWDGTLFDNHHFNFIALAHGLNTHGVSITEDWFHENSGFSARGIVEEAIRLADSDASADEVLASRDGYAEDRVGDIAPVAPVHDLLANPQGRQVGVVTGSNRSNIDALLRLYDWADTLDVLVTRDELQRGKPSPEGYLLAMKRLGVTDPATVLVYEDSDQGIEAALAAGASVVDVRPLLNAATRQE